MSTSYNNAPISRGEHSAGLAAWAGSEKWLEDIDLSVSPGQRRSKHRVRLRLVKNSSGIALLPKYAVKFKAGTNRTEVDGYSRLTADEGAAIVDEFLDANGVPDGEYFYVALDGPSLCTMPASQIADITEDDVLVAVTAAASTFSTTAGRVSAQDLTGATAVLGKQLNGALGRALSAVSSSSTNDDILVFLHAKWD